MTTYTKPAPLSIDWYMDREQCAWIDGDRESYFWARARTERALERTC